MLRGDIKGGRDGRGGLGGGGESVVFMALTLARSIGVAVINQSSAAANRTLRKGGGVSQSYFLAR